MTDNSMTTPLTPEAVAQMAAELRAENLPASEAVADMLTTLAAENATLRESRDGWKEVADRWASKVGALRASEAAALERITELESLLAVSTHSPQLPG